MNERERKRETKQNRDIIGVHVLKKHNVLHNVV